jgi:hypothetical protein
LDGDRVVLSDSEIILNFIYVRPGGVAQWTSHPPQEQEDRRPGSNPDRVLGF